LIEDVANVLFWPNSAIVRYDSFAGRATANRPKAATPLAARHYAAVDPKETFAADKAMRRFPAFSDASRCYVKCSVAGQGSCMLIISKILKTKSKNNENN
jgi:hypothetical protein